MAPQPQRNDVVTENTDKTPSPVRYLKGVGPSRAETLARSGISTVEDLLYYLPRKHEDRSSITPISRVRVNQTATICARVVDLQSAGGRYGRVHRLMLWLEDDTGEIQAVFFNQRYLEDKFEDGMRLILTGKVKLYGGRGKSVTMQLVSPAYEIAGDSDEPASGGIVPFYTVPAGLSQPLLRKLMRNALDLVDSELPDGIPETLRRKRRLPSLRTALKNAHFPETERQHREALRRLKYEEFFVLELALALRRIRNLRQTGAPMKITPKIDSRIRALYPFALTKAQEKVISQIRADLQSPHPMNRLLQGDVGSGKTAVAVYALLAAVANHYQGAFMAPTEILAEQHYRTLLRYLDKARVKMAFLTSSAAARRKEILGKIASGEVDIVVGTHALVQKDVEFANLGLAVVDEQHKFGVMQRASLRTKGRMPHVLVMTATPIPRTLSLTVYGDLDTSILDELPPGRRPVETHFVRRGSEKRVFDFVKKVIETGRQAYFVYPLIDSPPATPKPRASARGCLAALPATRNDNSKAADFSPRITSPEGQLRSATEMHRRLSKEIFPNLRVALLHGRMKAPDKERIMSDFKSGRTDILVSTVVIEVGVDVPNAAVMVIDHCERFGLAQLHQLRGRIGRAAYHSTCLLLGKPETDEAQRRIKAILDTTDGFKIAEEDLRIRGPGQFFGTKQSGLPDLKIADIIDDFKILRSAREDAFELVRNDPALSTAPNHAARVLLMRRLGKKAGLISVG